MSQECHNCNTKSELCCSASKKRYQALLDELASKNRALDELREQYDYLCKALQEKHFVNQELTAELDKANENCRKWEKYSLDYKSYAEALNETWRKNYDCIASEVNLLKKQLNQTQGYSR